MHSVKAALAKSQLLTGHLPHHPPSLAKGIRPSRLGVLPLQDHFYTAASLLHLRLAQAVLLRLSLPRNVERLEAAAPGLHQTCTEHSSARVMAAPGHIGLP